MKTKHHCKPHNRGPKNRAALLVLIGVSVLAQALLIYSLVQEVSAAQPAEFDRNYDGYLDRYELGQYLEEEDASVKDLRGGLYLEPEIVRPYVVERFPGDDERVEY